MTALTAAALIAFTVGGCGGSDTPTAPAEAASTAPATFAAPTTTSPSPTVQAMTINQACQQAVEGSVDWINLVSAYSQGKPTTADEFQALSGKISAAMPYLDTETAALAGELVYPLDAIHRRLTAGDSGEIQFQAGKEAVTPIMANCAGKADLANYKSPYER
ncbi:hypothetical protein [Actinoplanes sp. NPDC048796]|uniref:hypothetical protein n=1 Tax=Actinoplanes sp. NPDC048796 TaxID=3155640 RepID=UPI0033E2A05B